MNTGGEHRTGGKRGIVSARRQRDGSVAFLRLGEIVGMVTVHGGEQGKRGGRESMPDGCVDVARR